MTFQFDQWGGGENRDLLLRFTKSVSRSFFGIPTGAFRGAGEALAESFIGSYPMTHVEIHDDGLWMLPVIRKTGISFSYHTSWNRGIQTEVERVRWLVSEGCKHAVVHPNDVDIEALVPIQKHIAVENLCVSCKCFRRAADFSAVMKRLPECSMCLDLGHLWDIPDEVDSFIKTYREKIVQIHLSETCRTSGNHLTDVSPEFRDWAGGILGRLNPRTLVAEPPLSVNVATGEGI